MSWVFRRRVVEGYVFDGISRADDLGRAVLALGRPHGQAGQEAAIPVFQFTKRVGNVASNDARELERVIFPILSCVVVATFRMLLTYVV